MIYSRTQATLPSNSSLWHYLKQSLVNGSPSDTHLPLYDLIDRT
jgi:hypothetical protein